MRLFSYKMTHDSGFAPNPFGYTSTLATCKPQIRLHKSVDDWIAGFTSRTLAGHGIPVSRIGCRRCWLNRPLSAGDTLIVQKIMTPTIAPVARAVTSKPSSCINARGLERFGPMTTGFRQFSGVVAQGHLE